MKQLSYDEKLNIVAKAIFEAKKVTPRGNVTKLYIAQQNGLKSLIEQEIELILRKLIDEEEVMVFV